MKWINRRRLLWFIAAILAVLVLFLEFGCTGREKKAAEQTGGALSRLIGLPPFVGESIATAAVAVVTYLQGHRRGRRKERACHIPKAPTP